MLLLFDCWPKCKRSFLNTCVVYYFGPSWKGLFGTVNFFLYGLYLSDWKVQITLGSFILCHMIQTESKWKMPKVLVEVLSQWHVVVRKTSTSQNGPVSSTQKRRRRVSFLFGLLFYFLDQLNIQPKKIIQIKSKTIWWLLFGIAVFQIFENLGFTGFCVLLNEWKLTRPSLGRLRIVFTGGQGQKS